MAVHHQVRVADDVSLEVATAGPPDAPPVMFVHGNGPNGRQFAPKFTSLADRDRLLAPSLRGHGRSEVPANTTVRDVTNLEQPRAFDDALQRFIDHHVTAAGVRT